MAKRKTTHIETFAAAYKRLEEVMLANSGENEFEEIFKIILIKLWEGLHNTNNIHTLDKANGLLTIIDANWPGVLIDTKLKILDEQFSVCIDIIKNFSFTEDGYEGIDSIFEYIISREKKGTKGQFFTPRYLVDFCVDILNPKPNESILDPAAGSGSFLYHAYLHGKINGTDLWGFDFDNTAVRIARLLMHVGSVKGAHIHKLNSLLKNDVRVSLFEKGSCEPSTTIEDILRIEKKKDLFDIIITNPPFAGEIIEPDLLKSYNISYGKARIERDVLFVERCISLLKLGGRMAIILPDNIFGSKDNEVLRRWIYDTCRVVGVVGIPRNAFMPHTAIKTSILFLQKREQKRKFSEEVFFGISEQSGKDSRGNLLFKDEKSRTWKNVEHDLDQIASEFKTFLMTKGIRW
ncbi:MAG: N-6 DNA methylase [Dorea sp.]|nr:N-6 DNA methylase [Dorea sp.]